MRVRVLGAAAGGGFPQWNANSEACRRARAGDPAARPATQASVAASSDGERWVLINASPDLRQQVEANPVLHPREGGLRSSPIRAVVLTNGDVDAVAGLLSLRERAAFALYAHRRVLDVLAANPIFGVLGPELVPRRELVPGESVELRDATGEPLGFDVLPFLAPGKLPLYLEQAGRRLNTAALEGDTLGLEIGRDPGRVVYLANCAEVTPEVRRRAEGAALLLMDGTLWRDDEMIVQGVGAKTGRRMGHVSMGGPEGAVASLADVRAGRRVFLHVNNTNPALLADSPERAELAAAGWEVAFDGMDLSL